jgi:thiol-disulfide isomerase/thioredoxin
VAAVRAASAPSASEKWCDVFYAHEQAPLFELPPAEPATGDQIPALAADRWLWINLWATWCAPCLREMPLLAEWHERLKKEGVSVEVWYLSVDEDPEDWRHFLERHPQVAGATSLRLEAISHLEPWLKKYRIDSPAAIPIHLLVAPGGKVCCGRVGQLHPADYPAVKKLLL